MCLDATRALPSRTEGAQTRVEARRAWPAAAERHGRIISLLSRRTGSVKIVVSYKRAFRGFLHALAHGLDPNLAAMEITYALTGATLRQLHAALSARMAGGSPETHLPCAGLDGSGQGPCGRPAPRRLRGPAGVGPGHLPGAEPLDRLRDFLGSTRMRHLRTLYPAPSHVPEMPADEEAG